MKFLIFFSLFLSLSALARVQTFGIVGDGGLWNENAEGVRNSLLVQDVKDLILPGDNLYDLNLSYEDIWTTHWSSLGFTFPVVALGNHFKTYADEMLYFKMPAEYYSTVIGSVRFIVLNSDNKLTVDEQSEFLRNELMLATEEFIFVVYHHPPFTLKNNWKQKEAFHLATRPQIMANKNKITAVIVGHDHLATLVQMDDLPVIVSGAVHETYIIPQTNHMMDGIHVESRWGAVGGYYWARLDVNDETKEVWVNFVKGIDNSVPCSMRISPRPVLLLPNCQG